MNQLDQLQRLYEGADYYQEEPEPRWPLWRLCYGWPVITIVIGIAAYAVWRHFL